MNSLYTNHYHSFSLWYVFRHSHLARLVLTLSCFHFVSPCSCILSFQFNKPLFSYDSSQKVKLLNYVLFHHNCHPNLFFTITTNTIYNSKWIARNHGYVHHIKESQLLFLKTNVAKMKLDTNIKLVQRRLTIKIPKIKSKIIIEM